MSQASLGSTCNGRIFLYEGQPHFILTYIILTSLVGVYLLYKTCRLCSIAFSYSNFHVHETYKLYVLGLVNLVFIIFSRKMQWDLNDLTNQPDSQYDVAQKGYELINDIFGVLSIFSNNYMHLYNGFTWLLIALSCDYTTTKERSTLQEDQEEIEMEERYLKSSEKEAKRKKIYILKNYLVNCLLMGMLVISIFGTLNHSDGDSWCGIVAAMLVCSSILPLLVFGVALYFYISRFWDPQISKVTKGGLIYLILAMVIRALYFLICSLKEKDLSFGGDVLSLCYTVFCTLAPILVMSLLGENQLKQEQFSLLKRSSLIFKSTVL